jgi:hypothetical protein
MFERSNFPVHWEHLDQETYMRRVLELQADQIEMVLISHRVPGRVTGGIVTPRWVSYQVIPEISTKIAKVMALSEEIALRLGAQGVRVTRQGAAIQVDVPREDGQVVRLLNLCKRLKEVPGDGRTRRAASASLTFAGGGSRFGGGYDRLW